MDRLIPQSLFYGLNQFTLVLIVAVATAVLVKAADLLVEGAAGIAFRMGMSKVIVGATIVSLGTTTPETAVSVMAAWEGNAGLALGNAVGSIVADTGLIFGLGCIITTLPADRFVLMRQGWIKIATGFLLAALCYGSWLIKGDAAELGRWVGILLLALLAAYLYVSVKWSRKHPHGEPFVTAVTEDATVEDAVTAVVRDEELRSRPLKLLAVMAICGLVLIILSSRILIGSVTQLAVDWGISQAVIAGTIVAIGTSLPELVVGMTAIFRGHKELLVGNVIGADILNVLFVIGASAAAMPLPIIEPLAKLPEIFLVIHIPAMIAMMLLFLVYIFVAARRGSFARWFGWPLVGLYVLYVVLLLVFGETA